MSKTNPTVDVLYPLAPWLKWLPLRITRRQVKLVRVDGAKPYFFDPECRWIEKRQTSAGVVYRAI